MSTAKRILQIFSIFATGRSPLTLSEIAAKLDIPVSSCAGLMKSLLEDGYVYSVGAKKHFYPTRRLLQDALAIDKYDPVLHRVLPVLEEMRDQAQESVLLAQTSVSGADVIYLAVLEGNQLIRYTSAPGQTRPLYQAATGKALLSIMSKKDRTACLAKIKTPQLKKDYLAALEVELAEGQANGYQIQKGQNLVDVLSIAAPIMIDGRGFAVGIAGPVHRMESNLNEMIAALKTCVGKLIELADTSITQGRG